MYTVVYSSNVDYLVLAKPPWIGLLAGRLLAQDVKDYQYRILGETLKTDHPISVANICLSAVFYAYCCADANIPCWYLSLHRPDHDSTNAVVKPFNPRSYRRQVSTVTIQCRECFVSN